MFIDPGMQPVPTLFKKNIFRALEKDSHFYLAPPFIKFLEIERLPLV